MKTFTNLKESYKFKIIRTCMWMTNSIGLTTRLKQHGVSVVYTYSLNQSIKDSAHLPKSNIVVKK